MTIFEVLAKRKTLQALKINYLQDCIVPRAGIEPAWVAPLVFETSASTYSAIWAFCVCKVNRFFSISNYIGHFFSKILCILWSKRAKSMGKRVVVPPHWAKSLC